MNNICCENGVFFVNELIPENKMKNLWITLIKLNLIEYFRILSAIPRWKLLIQGVNKLDLIDIVDRLKKGLV